MRNVGLDLSRGILMIYIIVIIHGVYWLKLIPSPYSSLLLLEMPIVFLVSGYAFALSSRKNKNIDIAYYWKYVRSRVSRIIIPYLTYAGMCAFLVAFSSSPPVYSKVFLSWLNPFSYGKGFSYSCLNSHLWFIPVFLIVSLLLPVCKTEFFFKLSVKKIIFMLCLCFLLLSYFQIRINNIIFYFIWAFLGFRLGSGLKIKSSQLLFVVFYSVMVIIIARIFFSVSLDMQAHKFPPDYLFLAFSTIWVSLALFFLRRLPQQIVISLANNKAISIFISYGYTLYLWQGLGYSLAIYIQKKTNINVIYTWFIAISLTIALGLIASPIEKVRWKQSYF